MKKIMIFIALTLSAVSLFGRHFSVELDTAGTLSEKLGKRIYFIDSLTVAGPINEADFSYMWESTFYGTVTYIDIANAIIADKKIPDNAFCHPKEQIFNEYGDKDLGSLFIKLRTIVLPDYIEEIGATAFGYSHLANVNLPSELRVIGDNAFWSCAIEGPLELPEKLEVIGKRALAGTPKSLYRVSMPSTLKRIGESAFANADLEEFVTPPATIDTVADLAFANNFFQNGIAIENTTLEHWGKYVFFNNWATEIYLGEGVVTIPESLFVSLDIENINFPSTLKTIQKSAFSLVKMPRIELNEGLVSIGYDGFGGSTPEEIVLPSTLKSMDGKSFLGTKLKRVVVKALVPPACKENSIDNLNPAQTALYVPDGSKEAYRQDPFWGRFAQIEAFEDMSAIPALIFTEEKKPYDVSSATGSIAITALKGAASYEVYTFDGRKEADGIATPEGVTVAVAPGRYIVNIGDERAKVIVR